MTKEQAKALLKGAYELRHPHRGHIMVMGDGSYMSLANYKKFRVQWILVSWGLRKEEQDA
jgi:hypothetical protein